MPETEDGGGPLDQAPTREHVYHPNMESIPIKRKGSRVSTRYINRLEIRLNINNYLHPYILQLENHLTIAYCRY